MATTSAPPEAVVELALDAGCDLGESPVWDASTQRLYFVDINGKRIHVYEPATGACRAITLSEPVGTIVPTTDDNVLLAGLQRHIVEVDVTTGATGRVLASSPEAHGTGAAALDEPARRYNDGKVSPGGALLIGRMHAKWRDGEAGRLYALRPGSSELEEVLSSVQLPNGMAWAPGKGAAASAFFFVDSGAESITEYAADAQGVPLRGADGTPLARTVVCAPTGHKHVPDGMTIDADGNLWVAPGESGSVVCYNAETGEELRRVALPVKRPTACTFGGPNLEHLYVTTRVETGEGASAHHGGLFRIAIPGVRGAAPAYKFAL